MVKEMVLEGIFPNPSKIASLQIIFPIILAYFKFSTYLCNRFWSRSSVGLEQRPSKAWVLGSNPNGITV